MKNLKLSIIFLTLSLGLSACVSPRWLGINEQLGIASQPDTNGQWPLGSSPEVDGEWSFIYKNYTVRIVPQWKVIAECMRWAPEDGDVFPPSPFILGCVHPTKKAAWSVDNYYVMRHECAHIDALTHPSIVSKATARTTIAKEVLSDAVLGYSGFNNIAVFLTTFMPAERHCPSQWILPSVKQWEAMSEDGREVYKHKGEPPAKVAASAWSLEPEPDSRRFE